MNFLEQLFDFIYLQKHKTDTHMKNNILLALAFSLILLSSCATPNIAYFQGVEIGQTTVIDNENEIRFSPEDQLSILVTSKSPEIVASLNLSADKNSSAQSNGLSGYVVNKKGMINFPVLGEIKIEGLTRCEVEDLIKNELITREIVKDPTVRVGYMNLYVSVLGEVRSPGRYKIDKDKITILEALSLAGDLTVYGKRDRVLVQREVNGNRTLYAINLNDGPSVYKSPVYYLQQNDLIYVEPNAKRAGEATVNGNTVRSVSFWISLTSMLTSITTMIISLAR